ncbi:D-alanyl-D-alanine carboxypeptidase/D-alanyl-D-alanine-endopeptidase (penicillin-binding protein 4) [Sphingobacterium allocomposti]|uniref:D-alanyl-D-alanine carboxypeptidase/D-alanyl-D-alanine-endopeptidase (Penicillin-binding protein 4) n=1 Tax=Sphingobacterium allocomposti TaxID=415956 RepID=A0A5S5DV57_9SPHI|nr:D-alanyl-D-alanine carboxypeptidase/D-alanyl-D-alanine-endopeptidase [Sphingobacterium composti Yoo et al. 2007 non Ten et al. 2007]TYP98499.1 D-alanyl-D-alanine carboxypeptidase/D-alanyl-D-alanine-endopeptidase (penicillin-binding protein 4) [Sphingobacterium composti Yoo et al. 2007 non Ten et al. 2007]
MKTSLYCFSLIAMLYTGSVHGQGVKEKIASAYQTFAHDGRLRNGIAAFTVLDGKTGAVIFSDNASLGLPTASTMKVITSITVLDILGPEYRFKTQLAYAGTVDSLGVLHGDLLISGSGDPTLGSDRYPDATEAAVMNKWIAAVRQAGISHVNGRIVGDDLHFNGNDIPGGWSWNDMGNYYGAGISGLNWRENKAGITFSPGNVGQPASIVKISSPLEGITLVNEVTTGADGTGDNVYAYAAPYSQVIYVRGTYGRDLKKTIEISVPDPAMDLAQQFTAALYNQGIAVDSLPTTGRRLRNQGQRLSPPNKVLDTHQSPPLRDIVYWFNQKSINLYGEALLKTFGLVSGNKPGTGEAAQLVTKYWEQKLKIQGSELKIIDGSGLSPQNRVTTAAMSGIMHYAQSRPWFADFEKSLPTINGMSMKSGTIGGVLGYTGYHQGKSGQVTFSLLVNNYTGSSSSMRQAMFKLLDSLK